MAATGMAPVRAEDLIGTWRLRSWKNVAGDGSATYPLGAHPVGYIFYNHDGYMSVEIMAAHRSGPFEVRPDEGTIIHHIEVCSFPNWIGNARVRFAKLEDDRLTLSTKPMTIQGIERSAELEWERIGRD